jgi:hypothetical protein
MIANYLGKQKSEKTGASLNQPNMGNDIHMKTDAYGGVTPWSEGHWTKGLNKWVTGTKSGYYVQLPNPTSEQFRKALRYDITDNHPFGVSTVEYQNETSYNNHNTSNDDIGHWLVAYGFSKDLDTVHLLDPATTVWSQTAPTIAKSTNAFVDQYVDNGISS